MSKKGIGQTLEFVITPAVVGHFVELTGDVSSLHTAEDFARRSVYRTKVVHGMVPVIFVAGLKVFQEKITVGFIARIAARFLKPVFVGDRLHLTVEDTDTGDEAGRARFDYIIRRRSSGVTVTTGHFIVQHTASVKKPPARKIPDVHSTGRMIADHLKEEDLSFERIVKGDHREFRFAVTGHSVAALKKILKEGSSGAPSQFLSDAGTPNLLAASLLSTLTGVCLPGKFATFMDFSLGFDLALARGQEYTLQGVVGFKSSSTRVIVNNVSIYPSDKPGEKCAGGKMTVKVNDLPVAMPSAGFLKANAMDLGLKGKVILITGASRGIGETTAKLFALHGAKVAVNYHQGRVDAQRVVKEIVGQGGKAFAIQADVTDGSQVKKMVSAVRARYGTVDILVNNAVRDFRPMPFLELTWEEVQKDCDVAVKGAFHCAQEIIPLMIKNKSGKIINLSTVAVETPPPQQSKYVVAKSALVGLTRSLAVEFAAHNIQVNMVVPSMVETDLTKHLGMYAQAIKNTTPMRRNATPVDVAKAIVVLASSLTPFTTGQKIMVTGGQAPFL